MGIYSSLEPAGTIKPLGSTGPTGNQLLCDGSAISRTSYPRLFAAIGTNFGNGDGSTTFNLPDCRGQFLRGQNLASGTDPDSGSRSAPAGGNTGDNVGSYQGSVFGYHSHVFAQWTQSGQFNGGGPAIGSGQFTEGTSGAGGNETRPVNVYVSYVITY